MNKTLEQLAAKLWTASCPTPKRTHIMNKKIFWTILLSLSLAACSFNISSILGGNSRRGSNSSSTELPVQTKLILGIINLDETENAVTAEQAKELLPMFHVLKDLNESDTAAQEEKTGLTNQIQETLTAEQVKAIEGMNLTRRDMFAVMQGNSGGTSSTQGGTNSTQTGSRTSGNNGGMDGPPDMGGFSGGGPGGGIPGGGFSSSGTTSTNNGTSTRSAIDTASTPSTLFEAVIKLLEKKIQ
jgi:hypothetical protein